MFSHEGLRSIIGVFVAFATSEPQPALRNLPLKGGTSLTGKDINKWGKYYPVFAGLVLACPRMGGITFNLRSK